MLIWLWILAALVVLEFFMLMVWGGDVQLLLGRSQVDEDLWRQQLRINDEVEKALQKLEDRTT